MKDTRGMWKLKRTARNLYSVVGELWEPNRLVGYTAEPPDRNNQHNVSCFPAGLYSVQLLYSDKHKRDLYHITNIPNRDQVEIHVGNIPQNSLGPEDSDGCVLLGNHIGQLPSKVTKEILPAVIGSSITFENWMTYMKTSNFTSFDLEVLWV